jgi:hypothetical protein
MRLTIGFSNGAFALKKSPQLLSSILMAIWLAPGPTAISLLAPSSICGDPAKALCRHSRP